MRILFSTCSPAHYMAPPRLADEQINCGPFFPDRQIGGRFVSFRTPKGKHDLFKLAACLPADQQPDAVVCVVDSSWYNVPSNIAAFRCPKILLVADTHHMTRPLLGMINYIGSEGFDRVVVLYTRHHLELFREAGVRNLYWFPALTFPFSDLTVQAAAQPVREIRLALSGQVANLHQRRLRLAGALVADRLPLELKAIPQHEGLAFYGASLIGFNVSANADLNLRTFEILASGAMLLTDRLAPESGQGTLWKEGRELVTYNSPEELVERARHYLARPAEARAIGEAGAQWIREHFSEKRRRQSFCDLIFDGRVQPEFAVAAPKEQFVSFAGDNRRFISALVVYEDLQRLHSTQETVIVVADATVPGDFAQMCGTLPRIHVARLSQSPPASDAAPPDLLVVSAARAFQPMPVAAPRVWCWDARPEHLARLRAHFGAAGMLAVTPESAYFRRREADTEQAINAMAVASRVRLQAGDLKGAFEQARKELTESPRSLEAHIVMAELALETGNRSLGAKMLAKAREINPAEPRIPLLELQAAGGQARSLQSARMLAYAWKAFDAREYDIAKSFSGHAVEADPASAEAHLLSGLTRLETFRDCEHVASWRLQGEGLKALRAAVELAPGRSDFCVEFALALREAGLIPEATETFRQALSLDPGLSIGWFGLGEALLSMDRPGEAAEALATGLEHSPDDRALMLWLGHARKRQGRVEEALILHRRSLGAPETRGSRMSSSRRRVVFIAQQGAAWSCMASVHAAFVADPEWETTVVGLPYLHPFYTPATDERDGILDFLTQQGIPHVRWDLFALEPDFADLVFLQNPYDVTRPEGWRTHDLIKLVSRLAYVPYAIEIGGTEEDIAFQFNMPLQQLAWAVFARSEDHRAMFARHCLTGAAHVSATGHPKFDVLSRLGTPEPDPDLTAWARGRPIIIWNPHFDVRFNGTRFGDGYSTFLRWRDFLPEEFARRPDLAFIVRPHPLFFAVMDDRGILSAAQKENFQRSCASAGNILIDRRPNYEPVFAAAAAMISDCSSLLLEFGVTGKPVCHLHNPHGPLAHLAYELDLDWVKEHCAWATTEEEIRSFLDRVAAGGNAGGEVRAADLRRRMGVGHEDIGSIVKGVIEDRLAAEGLDHAEVAQRMAV